MRFSMSVLALLSLASGVRADVIMEEAVSLPGFTVYRTDAARAAQRLPIVAWANGGCANQGNSAATLLSEIASHGYLVIAIGPIGASSPPRSTSRAGTPEEQLRAAVEANGDSAPTQPRQLIEAIDWAIAANERGPLKDRVDVDRVAVAGHSCGGLQAMAVSSDRRIDTTILLNSGVFEQPRVRVDKTALAALHAPIAYFIGGSGDMAYANAEDDFARLANVPALKANNTFGHGGRLKEQGGGPTAKWVVRWLDAWLKDDASARRAFAGNDCELCREPGWSVERKGL